MINTLTPQAAADTAKVARSTIMRALESRELVGIQGNRGRWQIERQALEDWLTMRPERTDQPLARSDDQMSPPMIADNSEVLAKLASLETEVRLLHSQIDDLRADRDAWRTLVNRGFWSRLFG